MGASMANDRTFLGIYRGTVTNTQNPLGKSRIQVLVTGAGVPG